MTLKVQIISLMFSFFFGIVFSFFVNINYNFLFMKNKIIQVIITFFFVLDCALFYFLILKIINNGIIHPYFYLMIILGFCFSFPFNKKFRKNNVK